jgi:hypothetical protein
MEDLFVVPKKFVFQKKLIVFSKLYEFVLLSKPISPQATN